MERIIWQEMNRSLVLVCLAGLMAESQVFEFDQVVRESGMVFFPNLSYNILMKNYSMRFSAHISSIKFYIYIVSLKGLKSLIFTLQ